MVKWITNQPLFRALKDRSFFLLWGGQSLSRVGDFLYQIVLAWWVLEETGSAAMMASVFIVAFVPTIVFGLIGGVAVDRYPRIQIMLTSDLVRGITLSIAAALAWQNSLQIWHIYVMSLILELVDVLFQPAYAAVIPRLVPEEELPSANSLTSLSTQAGRIIGPLLGATLIALGGTATAFALNGISFFIAAALLIPLLRVEEAATIQDQQPPKQSLILDFKEGIASVFDRPWLWISILVFALSNVTLVGPFTVTLPFLVEEHLKADVGTLGFLYAMFALGYVVGGIWLGRKPNIRWRGRLIYGGLVLAGVMLLVIGLPIGLFSIAIAALINGAALEVSNLAWTNSLQEYVPHEKLGRVVSVDAIGSLALVPIGYGLAGWATELWGAPLVFVLGGALTTLVALLAFCHPAVRSLD